MTSAERSYEHSTLFITSGIYDTLEALGGEVVASPGGKEVVRCRLTIDGKRNSYRFTVHPLPFGCLLRIESENPDHSLSAATEKRLLNAIFDTLKRLIEDAMSKHVFPEKGN
jgi:hypothetical protein